MEINQLSSIDINHLINEFQKMVGGKIENVYQNEKNIYFQIYKSGEIKQYLKIMLPHFIYLTTHKENIPQMPPQFCTILRKNLKSSKIISIKQIELERIIEIQFQRKDNTFKLFIELFGTGNVILCNSDQKIIYPLEYKKWKERTIKGGMQYFFPTKDFNLKNSTKDDINKIIASTKMDSTVTFIAKEIGTGGKVAEILCKKLEIEKNSKPTIINSQKLLDEINKILKNNKTELNTLLDKQLTDKTIIKDKEIKNKNIDTKKNKFEKILDAQRSTIKKQEKIILDAQSKAELIYQNYAQIESIIKEIHKIKEKHTWKEIKEKLKNHPIIKKINEKTGKITLELFNTF